MDWDDAPVLIVFAKPPVAGVSKTRIGAALGDDVAARLAAAFLSDTLRGLAPLGVRVVVATTDPEADHGVPCERWDQGGGDLGLRIERMLQRGLTEAPFVVAVGADAPGMPLDRLRELMDGSEVAIGPAEDGGFWGLLARRWVPGALAGVPWSAPNTAFETVRALGRAGLDVSIGPRWWDIDTVEDLRRFRAARLEAPATHAVLDEVWGG